MLSRGLFVGDLDLLILNSRRDTLLVNRESILFTKEKLHKLSKETKFSYGLCHWEKRLQTPGLFHLTLLFNFNQLYE